MSKNHIISALLCICMLLCICSCTSKSVVTIEEASASPTIINASETEAPKNDIDYSEHSFAIHYIDVGQGDAALVVCDDKIMLIDGGKPSAGSIIYTYLKKYNKNAHAAVALTHYLIMKMKFIRITDSA